MPATGVISSDFRSDTVTKPSAAMREAMARAEVGDDVLDGDPTVQRLERACAEWLGKQEALFVPSGTMANQVALGAWTRPGDEIVVQRWAHVSTFEAGAAGYLHGLQCLTLGGLDGGMQPDEVQQAIRPDYLHCPRTGLVCLEQTHNVAGGRVIPMDEIAGVGNLARSAGIPVHLDGARLANAVVASGIPASEWAVHADSVALCLSKGLGAPVGSVIAGDAEFCERGRLVRKRLGGWMRQSGVLAAAGLLALEQGVERLAQDHDLALQLKQRLEGLGGLSVEQDPETNIVMFRVARADLDAPGLVVAFRERGIGVMSIGERLLRFVTHLGVGLADVEALAAVAAEVLDPG